jgi:hypothetical protein
MYIEKAVKFVHNLTDDELFRYAQLCEVDIVNYKESIKNYTPEQMLKYGIPYIQSMKDNKATFLAELESRKNAKQPTISPKTGFTA